MNEQLKNTFEPLKQFWNNTSNIVKKVIIGGIVIILTISLALSILLNSKEYVVIFDQLSETETSEILAKLQEMDVNVKLDGTGSIMVLKDDESSVRMALATDGYPKSGLSYYLIEQNSGMLTTDYERKQYVNMQLQERIAASIKTLDGVKDAVVTITTPSDNVFYLQEKEHPTASVIIHMNQGTTLSESQILGIQNLVAKSVSGLSKDNIALSDSQGNDLIGDSNNADFSKINITREIENDFRKKIYAVLEGPYQSNQLKISVTATVDTDDLITEQTVYTPSPDGDNTGVISEETSSEESYTSSQQDGGIPGTSSNSQVPTYQTGGTAGNSTSTSSSESRKYQVSQTKSQMQKSGAKIESISIGIAIDKAVFDPGERESVTQLVAFAVGVSPESIAVQNFKFHSQENNIDTPSEEESGMNKMLLYGGISGGLLLLVIAAAVLLLMGRRKKSLDKRAIEESESINREDKLDALFGTVEQDSIPHITPVKDSVREEIKDFAKSNPEIAAQMIKSWLRSEND